MTFTPKCWKSGPCVDGVQCCCTFVLLCCLQPGWRKSDRRFDQGKASLWCGLPCGGSDLILTLCPTSGLRGLCLYGEECVSLLYSCWIFSEWIIALISSCGDRGSCQWGIIHPGHVWCELTRRFMFYLKKNFHLRLIHFILFLASLVLMQTTFYSVYKSN